jgi:hypothetical protein
MLRQVESPNWKEANNGLGVLTCPWIVYYWHWEVHMRNVGHMNLRNKIPILFAIYQLI